VCCLRRHWGRVRGKTVSVSERFLSVRGQNEAIPDNRVFLKTTEYESMQKFPRKGKSKGECRSGSVAIKRSEHDLHFEGALSDVAGGSELKTKKKKKKKNQSTQTNKGKEGERNKMLKWHRREHVF